MKKLIMLLTLFFSMNITAQEDVKIAFLEKWSNSKDYLLEVAKAMPEEFYSYKPTEREMTFGEQMVHIKSNMEWLSTTYFTTDAYEKKKETSTFTKQEIIAMLEKSFDNVSTIIEKTSSDTYNEKVDFFAGPKTKLQILNLMQDHVTHHRGQTLVYLNLNNIKPPKYVGW